MLLISQNLIKHTSKGLPAQIIDEPRPNSNINQARPSSDISEIRKIISFLVKPYSCKYLLGFAM